MTSVHTIRVVPSRRGWLAIFGDAQHSIDGREHNPGVAALALAEALWPGRNPVIKRIAHSLSYSVTVDESRPDLASRTHTPASGVQTREDKHP